MYDLGTTKRISNGAYASTALGPDIFKDRVVWSDNYFGWHGATEIWIYKGDGIGDNSDNCPSVYNPTQVIPTWYRDADGDGYGNSSLTTQACIQPAGYVANNTDCDDTDSSVNPGATEILNNGKDDDCNPATSDTLPPSPPIITSVSTPTPGTAALHWNAPTTHTDGTPLLDLAGFKIHYGTSPGNYTTTLDVGNTTTSTVLGLSGGTYYFMVTAYDTVNSASGSSNEVSQLVIGTADTDGDGIPDDIDNCPTVYNPGQEDFNNDGYGDACQDSDYDGILDNVDVCPGDFDNDIDNDGICAGAGFRPPKTGDHDNCPSIPNPPTTWVDKFGVTHTNSQPDFNLDGVGDACETPFSGEKASGGGATVPDSDGDGIKDALEPASCVGLRDCDGDGIIDGQDNCIQIVNADQKDIDNDGLGDACDDDIDGDGKPNASDNCPYVYNPNQEDMDADGIGDVCDDDVDGDGISNKDEIAQGTSPTNPDTDGDNCCDGPGVWRGTPSVHYCGASRTFTCFSDTTPLGNTRYIVFNLYDDAGGMITDKTMWLPKPQSPYPTTSNLPAGAIQTGHIRVEARLYDPVTRTDSSLTNVTFNLSTSNYTGVATNDGSEVCNPTCSNDYSFDLNDKTMVNVTSQTGSVDLYSFDYGGIATITASANSGAILGRITLPIDSDNDNLPDIWEDMHKDPVTIVGNAVNVTIPGLDKLNPHIFGTNVHDGYADVDRSADNTTVGDGLNNFKEYRGIISDVVTLNADGSVASVIQRSKHEQLDPRKKDLFVRGDGYKNSRDCAPDNPNRNTLNYCTDVYILSFTVGQLPNESSFVNAFEEASVKVHDMTGMPSFSPPLGTQPWDAASYNYDPPHIDVLVVTNNTTGTNTPTQSYDGYVGKTPSTVRQWTWDEKGYSYFGNSITYDYYRDESTTPPTIKRGTVSMHKNLMHYFYNKPYREGMSDIGHVANSGYDGILDPLSSVEDKISEDGTLQVTRQDATNEDKDRDSKLKGDFYKTDWMNTSYSSQYCSGQIYCKGYHFSVFDADGNGKVELPVLTDAQIQDLLNTGNTIRQYSKEEVQRHTVIHEMGHGVGISNPEHPSDNTDVMYVPVIDWNRAGHFSPAARQQIRIHNRTEF
jgi:hypothetical protein